LVAAYGVNGRIVAALAVNAPLLLPTYQALIEARAPFPPQLHASDGPAELHPVSAGFPSPGHTTHSPVAASTGPGPSTPEPPTKGEAARMKDPRVPPGPPPL
jgi:3-phenylpropionate/trans-cinnamate dioxygenase ferredoxin reductase subunit